MSRTWATTRSFDCVTHEIDRIVFKVKSNPRIRAVMCEPVVISCEDIVALISVITRCCHIYLPLYVRISTTLAIQVGNNSIQWIRTGIPKLFYLRSELPHIRTWLFLCGIFANITTENIPNTKI